MRARVVVLAALVLAGCGEAEREVAAPAPTPTPTPVPHERVLWSAYMGVSCPEPNSIACDRVGLAVWLHEDAESVRAEIAGRPLALEARHRRNVFEGFLQPAGLLDGPLKVTPDDGPDRWVGRTPVSAPVRLWIDRGGGRTDVTELDVHLAAGWG